MKTRNDERRQAQLGAIWRWRWLGFRDSTPAFKASIVLLILGAVALAAFAIRG